MLSLLLLGAGTLAHAKCYDGGGNFKLASWPICHEASLSLSVYSGLSADGQFVKLGLHAQGHTKGWSSIGFSGNGGMKGASQIVVRLDQDQWVAEDRFSLDYVTPTLDTEQNVRLIFAQDNGVNTSWGVVVPKDSCDSNDYATEAVSRPYLWALGSSHTFVQHATRGQFLANLINGTVPLAALIDTTNVDVKMKNATVVSASADATNPYICSIFDLRELLPGRNFSEKVHVAKFSPYLDPATAHFVHHMILYACNSNQGFVHNTLVPNCQSMPAGCNTFKWVWAVGSEDLQLPDDVGMPVGEGMYFLALQMHYYNPQQLKVNDTSGVTLSFTSTNRPIDAAIMQLNGGTGPFLRPALPANSPRFTLEPPMIVPDTCTSQWQQPITLVGAVHHMHLVGVHQRIEVARGTSHLGMLRYERVYDFKHQSMLEPLVKVLKPGDSLKLTCDYNTLGKFAPTEFGENTDNEMCWAALMFYPAQSFSNAVIQASPSLAELQVLTEPCLTASTMNSSFSKCAQLYFNDPVQWRSGTAGGFNASVLCNIGPVAQPAAFAQLQVNFPDVCPLCYHDGNCTVNELLEHGQGLCWGLCHYGYSVSTYPDVSRQPVYHAHITYCDGTGGGNIFPSEETFPAIPTCVVKGNLATTSVVQTIASAILADQSACPNQAIKAVFSNCIAADLTLAVGKTTTFCQSQCGNATAQLHAAFAAMVPVPSGSQKAQCVIDYNTTWTPSSTGGPLLSSATVLDARVRTGATLCDPMAPTSAPLINAAPLAAPTFMFATAAVLFHLW